MTDDQEVIDVLRELAEGDPLTTDGLCWFCHRRILVHDDNEGEHRDDCVWLRATAVVEQADLDLLRKRLLAAFDIPPEFLPIIENEIELRRIVGTEEEQAQMELVRHWREWVQRAITAPTGFTSIEPISDTYDVQRRVNAAVDALAEDRPRYVQANESPFVPLSPDDELRQAQRYFHNVPGRVQVASHPESYKGAYVRTESLSRWPGCGRKKAESPDPCERCDCKPDVPYGFDGWVVEDAVYDGQRTLVTDEGMGFPIDLDTVVTFPEPHRPMDQETANDDHR